MARVICPSCGRSAIRTQTRFGERHDCCGLWSWDGKPLVDIATHEARKAAHAAFDPLWKSLTMSRGEAYHMLCEELGMSRADCHMSLMTAEQARQVPAAVERIRVAFSRRVEAARSA